MVYNERGKPQRSKGRANNAQNDNANATIATKAVAAQKFQNDKKSLAMVNKSNGKSNGISPERQVPKRKLVPQNLFGEEKPQDKTSKPTPNKRKKVIGEIPGTSSQRSQGAEPVCDGHQDPEADALQDNIAVHAILDNDDTTENNQGEFLGDGVDINASGDDEFDEFLSEDDDDD